MELLDLFPPVLSLKLKAGSTEALRGRPKKKPAYTGPAPGADFCHSLPRMDTASQELKITATGSKEPMPLLRAR
jgi:hypothetical protein